MHRVDLACIVVVLAFATHAAAARACTGDCGTRGLVGVGDLVRAVTIALGEATLDACAAIDADANGSASVGELVAAVGNALDGCPTVIDQRTLAID